MEAKKEKKDMCLLDAMERIVALAKGSSLSDKFYNKADEHIRFVADKLQLNKQQSVLLAIFIDKSDDRSICANEIAEFLQCTTIQILKCMNDINELASREYIYKRQNDRQQTFRVPLAVVEAFTRNEPFIDKAKDNLTLSELMGELESIFDMRSDCELSYKQTASKINRLLDANNQLLFCKKLKALHLDEESKMLLVLFCHLFANNDDEGISFRDIEFLFTKAQWSNIKSMLSANCHILQFRHVIDSRPLKIHITLICS